MSSTRHIAGLDGLRAIACLAVFGVHLQQQTNLSGAAGPFDIKLLLQNGNTGVCLFFMLSGFLLSLPFWVDRGSGAPSRQGGAKGERTPAPPSDAVASSGAPNKRTSSAPPFRNGAPSLRWAGGFALRRIGRIVPAYYVCLFALVALGGGEGVGDVVMHALFIHNLSEATFYSINDPFWTIAVQAQFYIVFAVLMLLLMPLVKNRLATGMLLILGIVGAFVAHLFVMKTFHPLEGHLVLSHSLLAYLPHFLLGMLAALVFAVTMKPDDTGASQRRLLNDLFFWLALAGIVIILGIPAQDAQWRIPSGAGVVGNLFRDDAMLGRYNFPYVPLLVAILIITAPRATLTTKLLQFRPLRSIGIISYGLYVYHLPCLSFLNRLMTKANMPVQEHWIFFGLTGLAMALIVAMISFVFIERPLMKWSRRRTRTNANVPEVQI